MIFIFIFHIYIGTNPPGLMPQKRRRFVGVPRFGSHHTRRDRKDCKLRKAWRGGVRLGDSAVAVITLVGCDIYIYIRRFIIYIVHMILEIFHT